LLCCLHVCCFGVYGMAIQQKINCSNERKRIVNYEYAKLNLINPVLRQIFAESAFLSKFLMTSTAMMTLHGNNSFHENNFPLLT